jgi:hypothetical protein
MSALRVQGTICGVIIQEIKPRPGQRQFDPFTVTKYYVMNGGNGAPTEVTVNGAAEYKSGDKVDLPVYIATKVDHEKRQCFVGLRKAK